MRTLLLDTETWDLVLDASMNIALAEEAYGQAQDAASQIKLFQGELWYDTDQGIPYWQQILGHMPSAALMKARFNAAALLVPDVVAAQTFFISSTNRTITGQVQIVNNFGTAATAGF